MTININIDHPLLDASFCTKVVVRNTPNPAAFNNNPQQTLDALGVIDGDQADRHRARIQADLKQNHFSIKQDDISTGPGVAVGTCVKSVLGHAH